MYVLNGTWTPKRAEFERFCKVVSDFGLLFRVPQEFRWMWFRVEGSGLYQNRRICML